jgi:hypothetical protein
MRSLGAPLTRAPREVNIESIAPTRNRAASQNCRGTFSFVRARDAVQSGCIERIDPMRAMTHIRPRPGVVLLLWLFVFTAVIARGPVHWVGLRGTESPPWARTVTPATRGWSGMEVPPREMSERMRVPPRRFVAGNHL